MLEADAMAISPSFRTMDGRTQKFAAMKKTKNQQAGNSSAINKGNPSIVATSYGGAITNCSPDSQAQYSPRGSNRPNGRKTEPESTSGLTQAQINFLSLRIFPARLNRWQTATLLGITKENVSALIKEGILTPLNQGVGTTVQFALVYVMAIREDYKKLYEITNARIQMDVHKNAEQIAKRAEGSA